MNLKIAVGTVLFLFAAGISSQTILASPSETRSKSVRYVALGDSYTIGQGVEEEDSWPSLLARHLHSSGINIALVANPARTGWTVQQVIDHQLPVFHQAEPTFATLLIGVNDWLQGTGNAKFTQRLKLLLDRMQSQLPGPNRLLLITIPDFSCSPAGSKFGYGKSAPRGITRYNGIIRAETAKRGLKVVDIFPLSQRVCGDPEMFAEDGLHPSAKQYRLWESLIFPAALESLQND